MRFRQYYEDEALFLEVDLSKTIYIVHHGTIGFFVDIIRAGNDRLYANEIRNYHMANSPSTNRLFRLKEARVVEMAHISLYEYGSSRIEPERPLARLQCFHWSQFELHPQWQLDAVQCAKISKKSFTKRFSSIIDERLDSAAEEAEYWRHNSRNKNETCLVYC